MRYANILLALSAEIWAMEELKLVALIDFVALQASGIKFSADEIEARIAPATAAAVARREGSIAVLPIRGVIANRAPLVANASTGPGFSTEAFEAAFDAALNDDQVKAIIFDVDSPGGTVTGVDEAAARIFAARGGKPIVAQVTSTCASAAYHLASAADEIVVTPTGSVGSIGVRTIYEDVAAKLEKEGVKPTIISAGKYKGEGIVGPLSDDTLAYLQSRVDSFYGMFVDRVAQGRGVASAAVREGFGQGRMVGARDAVAQGMADRVGTMGETLARFGVPAKASDGRAARQRRERALALN